MKLLLSWDPLAIAVFVIATRTVVVIVVFAAETVSVAAVVSGPAVWEHHAWSAHRGRLPPILISICTLDSCRTMRYLDISSFNSDDPSWVRATDLVHDAHRFPARQ